MATIEVFDPKGHSLGRLNLDRFRIVKPKGKPEKHVFIRHLPVPADGADGWYRSRVTLKDGNHYDARDYVVIEKMPRAGGMQPADGSTVALPTTLRWQPIPGASDYEVFIKDLWNGEKVIYTSKFLKQPQLTLPPGVLKADGYYAWRVHARNINGDMLFGDFDYGSLSRETTFTVGGKP